jgi:GH15 family glucan-1,4-alpha-glucosidase
MMWLRSEVLLEGYDADRRTFTQSYGSSELDASALLFPLVGFIAASDERVRRTVAAIERHFCQDGLGSNGRADAQVWNMGEVDE